MANRHRLNSHEMIHLNPDNNEQKPVPDSPTTVTNVQFLSRMYNKPSFFKCCTIYSIILFILLLVTGLLLYLFVFKQLNCPLDKTEYSKLVSYCSHILQKDDICKYRYDELSKECYKIGDSHPCGTHMVFTTREQESYLGICSCYNQKGQRALIMDNEKKNCYYIFEQGPCDEGEWLNFDIDSETQTGPNLKCEESFCKNETHSDLLPILIKDENENDGFKCVVLGEKSEYCEDEDYLIEFTSSDLFPKCIHKNNSTLPFIKLSHGGSPGSRYFEKPRETFIPPASGKLPSRRKGKVIG